MLGWKVSSLLVYAFGYQSRTYHQTMNEESSRRVLCEQCGTELNEEVGIPYADRPPCPQCDSARRKIVVELKGTIRARSSLSGRLTVYRRDQSIEVEPGIEHEIAYDVEMSTSPVKERTVQVKVWYERGEDGHFILHAPAPDGEQRLPFYVGPGNDPDSAAIAIAEEWLRSMPEEEE